jgi:hypothetical protein
VSEPKSEGRKIFGVRPILLLFAAEYMMQGLANPFQAITYQPFFKHFHVDYGLDEASTQKLFARSYLAWAFKPIIGFFVDAIGQTKRILVVLLATASVFFALSPALDRGPTIFFWTMFALAVVMACTDVVVDRATVVEGDAEAHATGKSKAAAVGMNQAICWIAIYGTGMFALLAGGWIADNVPLRSLLMALALVPAAVLCVALLLPKDQAKPIPLGQSVKNFWVGLNTGPLLWVVLFYFLFHFQPQGGAIWNAYVIDTLGFSQTQAGYGDSAAYCGYLAGTIAFARWGLPLQDKLGLKRLFTIFIPLCAVWTLTQLLLVDPTFTRITSAVAEVTPVSVEHVRMAGLCANQFFLYTVQGFVRMSTFSLVGVVIPAAAAGSLFAGFMSVANLGYSFSYSTGSWLYANGMSYSFLASLQLAIFGVPPNAQGEMSIAMLTLIGALAYFLSFLVIRKLPDVKETRSSEDVQLATAESLARLGPDVLRGVNVATAVGMVAAAAVLHFALGQDPIASSILSFFGGALVRKAFLDWRVAALA